MEWLEDLVIEDEQCPPNDAKSGNYVLFRVVKSMPAKLSDFYSYRKLNMFCPPDVSECQTRSCSVFCNVLDAKTQIEKTKGRIGTIIVCVKINPDDGVILNTPSKRAKRHFSWWITKQFEVRFNETADICIEVNT